jgi:hypothetical protein
MAQPRPDRATRIAWSSWQRNVGEARVTKPEKDATECTLATCERVGLYAGLNLSPEKFRVRKCGELVDACKKTCPLDAQDYGQGLLTFREALRSRLKDKGYSRMTIRLLDLCASLEHGETTRPYTWGDWCDDLANTLAK